MFDSDPETTVLTCNVTFWWVYFLPKTPNNFISPKDDLHAL